MFWLFPLVSGLGTWAATGDFKKGLLSAALGAGIGGIAGALGNAGSTVAGGTDLLTKGAESGITAANAATGLTGELAASGASMLPQGIEAAGKAAQIAGAAPAAAGGSNQIMQAGLNFLKQKPVTSGLMLSALTSAGMAPGVDAPEDRKGERFKDEWRTVDRNTLPFTGQPAPGPSTYTRNEPFVTDNPYRYGQYEGEKMFFDNPGLERGADGGIPSLPEGENEGDEGGLMAIIKDRIRTRGKPFAGGGLLKGPGDGQSDEIPATSSAGPVLLSDGEFVIPADVVAALGAGSTDAGAKRLYTAMDKIRTQSYGSSKQAKRPGRVSI